MTLSEKWANHLSSNLPPRSVARINELIMPEEHFELRMKDAGEQRVMLLCIIKSSSRNVGLGESPMPQWPEPRHCTQPVFKYVSFSLKGNCNLIA